jgi:hypothetical protein
MIYFMSYKDNTLHSFEFKKKKNQNQKKSKRKANGNFLWPVDLLKRNKVSGTCSPT